MRKKTGRVIGRMLLYVLLYVGIGLLASPLLKYVILEWEGSRYRFGDFTAEELEKNQAEAGEIEMEKDIAIPDLMGILKHIGGIDRKDVIGGIAIPAADLYLPVFSGTTKANLMAGAGTMQPGQEMGKGNYALAGHHMRDERLLFGPLLQVKEGDYIHLTDKKTVYTYEAEEIEIIPQTNISVMAETEEAVITLITCDKTGVNTDNRLMVRGRLTDISGIEEENEYTRNYLSMELEKQTEGAEEYYLWIWLAGVGLAAGAALWILSRMMKKEEEKWERDGTYGSF